MTALFAATKPERTSALILANTSARFLRDDDYPIGIDPEALVQVAQVMEDTWGTEAQATMQVPSRAGDESFRAWYAKYLRTIASRPAVGAFFRELAESDARSILSSIHVPTLVMHRRDYPLLSIQHGRYLAEHIGGARFVEVSGADAPLIWDQADVGLDAVEQFLTGRSATPDPDRVLATVLFTDVVSSTERAGTLGDRRWGSLIDAHDQVVARVIERSNGHLVKTTGDRVLATFDGPGRAIRCARALRDEVRSLGLTIRIGLHAGEITTGKTDVSGLAVHIAARVMASANADEILVSRTVRDLIVGSDFAFETRGVHQLKAVDGTWELFALTTPGPRLSPLS
jgi:class 3 adenylate cyclase